MIRIYSRSSHLFVFDKGVQMANITEVVFCLSATQGNDGAVLYITLYSGGVPEMRAFTSKDIKSIKISIGEYSIVGNGRPMTTRIFYQDRQMGRVSSVEFTIASGSLVASMELKCFGTLTETPTTLSHYKRPRKPKNVYSRYQLLKRGLGCQTKRRNSSTSAGSAKRP